MSECMLTTTDNPYDPFEQLTLWRMFDVEMGYYTSEYLARFVNLTDEMTQKEEIEEVERAIDLILELNPTGLYKKFVRNETKPVQST